MTLDRTRTLARTFVGENEIILVDNHHTDPISLDAQMRRVLAELELISHGSTASWDSAGGHAAPGHRILADTDATVDDQPHEQYRKAYANCTCDAARTTILDEALRDLAALRVRQAIETHEETAEDFDRRIVLLLDQAWTVAEVARYLRCTETRVRTAAAKAPAEDPAELMNRPGMTVRSIAMRTGLSKSEVHRRLKRAA